jgi:hypothetical protein
MYRLLGLAPELFYVGGQVSASAPAVA